MKTFRNAVRTNDFVVTATLPLRPFVSRIDIQSVIGALKPLVHAIQIGDNWQAEGHMDALAVAGIALQQGVDPVIHFSCRDRNRIALQSGLLGAAGLGVTSLVLSRGQKLPDGLRGKVKGVFDTQPSQLFELAQRVGESAEELQNNGFFFGTSVPVIRPQPDWGAAQVRQRIEAGVRFFQTRPCLNIPMLRAYMRGLVRLKMPHRAAFVVELPVLTSVDLAREIRDSHPGNRIPDKLVNQVAIATDPVSAGVAISADALSKIASIPGVSGVNIVYDGDPAIVAEVLDVAKIVH